MASALRRPYFPSSDPANGHFTSLPPVRTWDASYFQAVIILGLRAACCASALPGDSRSLCATPAPQPRQQAVLAKAAAGCTQSKELRHPQFPQHAQTHGFACGVLVVVAAFQELGCHQILKAGGGIVTERPIPHVELLFLSRSRYMEPISRMHEFDPRLN